MQNFKLETIPTQADLFDKQNKEKKVEIIDKPSQIVRECEHCQGAGRCRYCNSTGFIRGR